MKKTAQLTVAAFILAALAGSPVSAFDAKVTSVTGKVECQKKSTDPWTPVQQNDSLEEGAIISTGFNSYVTLNIDGNICTLQPLTRMSLEQLAQKDIVQGGVNKTVAKTTVFIDTGKATFKVNSTDKKLNDFKVHSPAATASVRGTEYEFDSNEGSVRTISGLVAVSAGTTRSAIDKNTYFISPEKKPNVFTSVNNVGGADTAVPVAAGESITYSASATERKTPIAQRKVNITALPDSTVSLSEREKCTPVASVFESPLPEPEKKDAGSAEGPSGETSISFSF